MGFAYRQRRKRRPGVGCKCAYMDRSPSYRTRLTGGSASPRSCPQHQSRCHRRSSSNAKSPLVGGRARRKGLGGGCGLRDRLPANAIRRLILSVSLPAGLTNRRVKPPHLAGRWNTIASTPASCFCHSGALQASGHHSPQDPPQERC
jgi:hypothetical protein